MVELQSLFKFCLENGASMFVEKDSINSGYVVHVTVHQENIVLKQNLPELTNVIENIGAVKYVENEVVNKLSAKLEELRTGNVIHIKFN